MSTEAWIAPSFGAELVDRVVTFKFPEEDGAVRPCLFSVLSRFEYFQKALGNWQERASGEIVVTDASTQTFDQFLRYLYTGDVDGELDVEGLLGLLNLANKYLLPHLVALCMSKILRTWVASKTVSVFVLYLEWWCSCHVTQVYHALKGTEFWRWHAAFHLQNPEVFSQKEVFRVSRRFWWQTC